MGDSELIRIPVALPSGEARVSAAVEPVADAWATIVLAHGAGSRFDSPFLVGFARRARESGVSTVRFNFPYSEAGRRMPGPAAHAVATWEAVCHVTAEKCGGPLWASGRSYGGRMASMTAAEGRIAPAGLVYLGYPLHPPGRPDSPRMEHLPNIAAPQLFVSGSHDPFVDPHVQLEDAVAACRDAELMWIPGGGHAFEVKGSRRAGDVIGEEIAALAIDWIRGRS